MKEELKELIHNRRLRATFKQQIHFIGSDFCKWQTSVLKKMYSELNESVRLEALSDCSTEEEISEMMKRIATPPSLPVEQIPVAEATPFFGVSLLLAAASR